VGEAAGDAATRGDSLAVLATLVVAGCAVVVVVVLPGDVAVGAGLAVAGAVVVVVLSGDVVALVTVLSLLVVVLGVAPLAGSAVVVAVGVATGSRVTVAPPPPHAASNISAASTTSSAGTRRCLRLPVQIIIPLLYSLLVRLPMSLGGGVPHSGDTPAVY
jgi:hypothetical protein